MTTDNDEFRTSLVAAVQVELDRHASAVVRELAAVREDAERDRADFLKVLHDEVGRIAGPEGSGPVEGRRGRRARRSSDGRVDEVEQRLREQIDEVRSGLSATVEHSIAELTRDVFEPFVSEVRREIAGLTDRLTSLDAKLTDFDRQAARLATFVSNTATRLDQRQDELAARVGDDVEARLSAVRLLVDEHADSIRSVRADAESRLSALADSVAAFGQQLTEASASLRADTTDQLAALEQQVTASIEAVAGRVSVFDERLTASDDRSAVLEELIGAVDARVGAVDDRFGPVEDRLLENERRTRSVADSVASIDLDAIDAMKDKMSAAAGEAMLVRIEMERFEKTIGERSDQLAVRLTEVETTLQDTTLDVAASVQLDRLEEIERALAELDPDQFVRKDGHVTDPSATAPALNEATEGTEVGDPESLTLASADAILRSDEPRLPERPAPGGSDTARTDIDAIIAAAEAANEREV